MSVARRLWLWFHRHRWEEKAWNGYYIAVEERCRCGAVRHHLAKHLAGFEIDWQRGPHPERGQPLTPALSPRPTKGEGEEAASP